MDAEPEPHTDPREVEAEAGLEPLPAPECAAAVDRLFSRDRTLRVNALAERPDRGLLALGDPDRRELFLAEVASMVVARGTDRTTAWLRQVFKFSRRDAYRVICEARRELAERLRSTAGELRAVTNARLEDLIRRCRQRKELDAEVKAIKEYARINGLYAEGNEGSLADLAALMRRITSSEGPRPKVVDAEFTVPGETPTPAEETWGLPDEWEPGRGRIEAGDEEDLAEDE